MAHHGAPDRRSIHQDMVVSVVFMAEHVTVKVVFNYYMKVSEAIKAVGEKCGNIKLLYPFNNYGLFLPPSENSGGVWLHYEDPINYYHIESKGVLEFKLKPIPLRVVIPDIKNKECTMVIDTTLPVSNVISMIKLKMRLPEPGALNCYRLNILDSDEILHESITLQAQGVSESTSLELLRWPKKKRKFAKKLTDKRDRISKLDNRGGVYGVPVGDIIARTGEKIVPLVVALTRTLEYRGFDKGDAFNATVSESDLRLARMAVNSGDPYVAVDDIKDINMLAALLKDYFKDLPDPLVQAQARGVLARLVAEIQPIQLRFIGVICCGLNEGHLYLLQHMLNFFKKILDSPKNKLDKTSLLNVWGPILLRAEHEIENGECIISTALLFNYYTYIDTLKPTPPEFVGLAQAMYPFHTDNDQEISFKAGEYIFVSNQDESGWWSGDLLNGSTGLFPSNYVELLLLFQSGNYDDYKEKEDVPVRSSIMTDYDDDEIEDITTSNRTSLHLLSSYPLITRVISPVQGQNPTSTSPPSQSQLTKPVAKKASPSSDLQRRTSSEGPNGHNIALQQDLERAKAEIASLKQQLESERAQLRKESSTVGDLKKEVQKMKDENTKLKDENTKLQENITKLQSEVDSKPSPRPPPSHAPPPVPPSAYPPTPSPQPSPRVDHQPSPRADPHPSPRVDHSQPSPRTDHTSSHRAQSPPPATPPVSHPPTRPPVRPAPPQQQHNEPAAKPTPEPTRAKSPEVARAKSPEVVRAKSPEVVRTEEPEVGKPSEDANKSFQQAKPSLFARQAARNSASILDKQHLVSPASPTPVRNAPTFHDPPAASPATTTPSKADEHTTTAGNSTLERKFARPPPPISKLPSSNNVTASPNTPTTPLSPKPIMRPPYAANRVSTRVEPTPAKEEEPTTTPTESKPIPIRPPPPNPKPNGIPAKSEPEPPSSTESEKPPLRPSHFANRVSTRTEPVVPKEEESEPKAAPPEKKFVRPPMPGSGKPSAPSPIPTTATPSPPMPTSTSPPQEPSPISSPSPPKSTETVGSLNNNPFVAKKPPPPRSFGRPPLKVAASSEQQDTPTSPPPSPHTTSPRNPPPSPHAHTTPISPPSSATTASSNPPARFPPSKPMAKKPAAVSPAIPASTPATSPPPSPSSASILSTSPPKPSSRPSSPPTITPTSPTQSAFQPKRPPPPKSASQYQSPPFPPQLSPTSSSSPASSPASTTSPLAASTEEPAKPVLKKHPFAIRK